MGKKEHPKTSHLFGKDLPKMPEGYYSGDKPNPNLRAFVEKHLQERPYDPETDAYDIPAFDQPIETTKATAIYNMHTYWSKKPHEAIRQYIRHYTQPGDLVLDPFCGSGGTALAALMEGRKAIAIDRSPAATFITKNYCTPVDIEELQRAFETLKSKVKPEIDWLYETRCDRCEGRATTAYTVYSQVFRCPRCLEKVPLFDCVEVEGETAKGKPKKVKTCPHCHDRGIEEEISTRSEKFGSIPVLVSYFCESGCKPSRGERRHNDLNKKKREYFAKYDLGKIQEIEELEIPHWYPTNEMIKGRETCVKRNLAAQGVNLVIDLFTKRNLWALSAMLSKINGVSNSIYQNALLFCWNSVLLNLSKMTTNRNRLGFLKGTYYIPQEYRCTNVLGTISYKFRLMVTGWKDIQLLNDSGIIISTNDVRSLPIKTNSIDYLFTDPPYGGKEQYGELNFVWESWLGLNTSWHDDEIIINETRNRTESDWAKMMKEAMKECYRVLKPGRWLSLCYHDTSEGTWAIIQDIMAECGFVADQGDTALFIDTKQKSYNQKVADKVTKRDLVINFRKPKPGEASSTIAITGNENQTTFQEKVRQIISEHLGANPGSTKDRVYDEVVSRMVRTGQMETHDFDTLLQQVADEVKTPVKKDLFERKPPDLFRTHEISRWYLKETELVIDDSAEIAREEQAAAMIRAFIQAHLQKNPSEEGAHYSDLFECYVYAVKDKPRRQLAEFLPDYFYKTGTGTWRLPASEEEEQAKREARGKGLGRRVKRYLALLEQGAVISEHEIPNDPTLAEWIRHCKRAGLYEQGKRLYEKGGINLDNLPEEVMVGVEEDYQVCTRRLIREEANEKRESKEKESKGARIG